MLSRSDSFTIRQANPDEEESVVAFMLLNFYGESLLDGVFGVRDARPPPGWSLGFAEDGRDFVVKTEDTEGALVGVAIVQRKVTTWRQSTHSSAMKNLVDFVNFTKEEAQLHRLPEESTGLRILAVRQDCRRRGLARRLTEESERLARGRGFKTMWSYAVSEYSARVMRSLGWREHYRLAYQDYPKISERDVPLMTTPPHDHLYIYVKDLE